jgi:CO/xanthine dehydrogenase FAD-binding subunit
LLQEHPDAGLVAGGTDLVVGHRSGKRALPETLIAIHRLRELQKIEVLADGSLRIGALVTHQQLETSPKVREHLLALADASALVGSPATRNAGTIGGNVSNASPAMEVGSPLLVSNGNVELSSASGTRVVPFNEFVVGPGKTTRLPGELVTAVILPGQTSATSMRRISAYVRLEYRQAMEIAVVGAAALLVMDNGRCLDARIALTAVAPTCVRAPEAEKLLKSQSLDGDAIDVAAEAAAGAARPIDDVRGSADYRRAMVPVIVRQALELAAERSARSMKAALPA